MPNYPRCYLSSTIVIDEEDPRIECDSVTDDEGRPVIRIDRVTIIARPRHVKQLVAACAAWLLAHELLAETVDSVLTPAAESRGS